MYNLLSKQLNSQELEKHRMWIALKAEALLNKYFVQPVKDEIKYEMMLGWMKALENFSQREIDEAFVEHLNEEPRRKPHEGIIRERIINNRRKNMVANKKVEPLPIAVTVDMEKRRKSADKIMKEVFGSSKRFNK
mgnify:FL=1